MIYYSAETLAAPQVCSAAFSPIFRQPLAVIMANSVAIIILLGLLLYCAHNNNVISTVVGVSSSPADILCVGIT